MRITIREICAIALMISCTQATPQKPREWSFSNYRLCDLKFTDTWSSLSSDLSLTIHRTNLDFGRYDNSNSMRPYLISGSTKTARDIGSSLIEVPGQTRVSLDFWSEDGSIAYIFRQWESPENAMWEEFAREMRLTPESYLTDVIGVNLNDGTSLNLTSESRLSHYNLNVFYWPAQPEKIGFHALINGEMRSILVDRDGKNKVPLVSTSGYSYTTTASKDGTRYAFHVGYKLYLGDAATHREWKVETPCEFNFFPMWAPDSQYVAFLCGTSNKTADVYIVDREGNNVRFLASRNGYAGYVPIFDVYDYHDGSSDYVAWSKDSKFLVYSSQLSNRSVELYRVDITSGTRERLTTTEPATLNYFPDVSPDGRWLLFASNRTGVRQAYVLDLQSVAHETTQITDLDSGCGVFAPLWRPTVHKR